MNYRFRVKTLIHGCSYVMQLYYLIKQTLSSLSVASCWQFGENFRPLSYEISKCAGVNCQINFDSALCTEHPGVCANGGLCRDNANHMSCDCNMEFKGQVSETCELLSRQFTRGNFLMLPGITNQWHFTLSLRYVQNSMECMTFITFSVRIKTILHVVD